MFLSVDGVDGGSVDHWVGYHWMCNHWMCNHRVCNHWTMGNHRVNWGVNGGMLGECGYTIILDIGNIAAWSVGVGCVGHNLGAAVRKGNPVVASHNLGVGCLGLAESSAAVRVLNTILKSIRLGCLIDHGVNRMNRVSNNRWGAISLWGGSSGGQDGSESNKGFHLANYCLLFDR